jgi:hypothetical protein
MRCSAKMQPTYGSVITPKRVMTKGYRSEWSRAPSKSESCSQTKDEHLSLGWMQCRMRDELHVVPSRMTWVMTVTTEHVILEKTV